MNILSRFRSSAPAPLPGERAIPQAGGARSWTRFRGAVIAVCVLGFVAASVAAAIRSDEPDEPERVARERSAPRLEPRTFDFPEPPSPEMEEPLEELFSEEDFADLPLASLQPEPEPDPIVRTEIVYRDRPASPPPPPAPIDKGAISSNISSATSAAAPAGPGAAPTAGESASLTLASLSQPESSVGGDSEDGVSASSSRSDASSVGTPAAKAALLDDPALTVPEGTTIDCVLATRIVSEIPGFTRCVTTRPIYSITGELLSEAGAIVTGEYQNTVRAGGHRVGVIWTRLRTPKHVVVALDSPAAGPLGATGLTGDVDSRFWARFGAAILVSFVDDAAAAAVASNAGAGTEITIGAGGAGAGVLETVLAETLDIRPTVGVDQGARTLITVARDLSFADVYREPRR